MESVCVYNLGNGGEREGTNADFIIKIFQKMQIQIKVCFRSYHFDIVLLGGNFSATLSVLINF